MSRLNTVLATIVLNSLFGSAQDYKSRGRGFESQLRFCFAGVDQHILQTKREFLNERNGEISLYFPRSLKSGVAHFLIDAGDASSIFR